MPLVSISSFTR